MTPHIEAKKGEIADIVLMPGDPLRAKMIAETYLDDIKLVNHIRNMFIYTGTYKGKKVSIAGSGMGMPSIGIYSYELFKFYDVETIIRIGSCGSYNKDVNVLDIFNAEKAYSESNYAEIAAGIQGRYTEATKSVYNLINEVAKEKNIPVHTGVVHSSDVFYRKENFLEEAQKLGVDVVEMESTALFANAAYLGKQAACLLTVSDSFITGDLVSAEDRQSNFTKMMELALEVTQKL